MKSHRNESEGEGVPSVSTSNDKLNDSADVPHSNAMGSEQVHGKTFFLPRPISTVTDTESPITRLEKSKNGKQNGDITSTHEISPRVTCTPNSTGSTSDLLEKASTEKNTNHNTRSMRSSSGSQKKSKNSSIYKTTGEEDMYIEDDAFDIDACASILARMDERGYKRAFLQDSNRLLEGIVLPMCLPWSHPVVPLIRNMPRDIDDMPNIEQLQDEVYEPFGNGTFGFGTFETGKDPATIPQEHTGGHHVDSHHRSQKNDDKVEIACRRSADSGVIEMMAKATPDRQLAKAAAMPSKKNAVIAHPDTENIARRVEADRARKFSQVSNLFAERALPVIFDEFESGTEPEDLSTKGELDLQRYERYQEVRGRKLTVGRAYTSKLMVSVKVESVSTRTSIFSVPSEEQSEVEEPRQVSPFLCVASLPAEVQSGRHVTLQTAQTLDDEGLAYHLGSYDCRDGSASAGAVAAKKRNKKSKDKDGRNQRVYVGRTRLIWTSKTRGSGRGSGAANNRFMYKSLLNCTRLDGGSFKRPREVKIGVRLNGQLLLSVKDTDSPSAKKRKNEKNYIAASNRDIDTAVRKACRADVGTLQDFEDHPNRPLQITSTLPHFKQNSMCRLDSEKLVEMLQRKPIKVRGWKNSSSSGVQKTLQSYAAPRLDCLPLNEGSLRVVCTAPGSLQPCWIPNLLNSSFGKTAVCSICWSSDTERHPIHECVECGVLAHLECCHDSGKIVILPVSNGTATSQQPVSQWKCSVCCHQDTSSDKHSSPRKTNRRHKKMPARYLESNVQMAPDVVAAGTNPVSCVLCPHLGGAMSPTDRGWIHEVCRLWCNDTQSKSGRRLKAETTCAICGLSNQIGLVKCAARGCLVRFHPMCARVVNAQSETVSITEQPPDLETCKIRDAYLCQQYTLSFAHCSRTEQTFGNEAGTTKNAVLPIAFCGWHNPKREDTLCGCPPGGFNTLCMRIPPVETVPVEKNFTQGERVSVSLPLKETT